MSILETTSKDAAPGLAVSGVARVTNVFINQPGPLPINRGFHSAGGKLLIFVSGSLRAKKGSKLMQVSIYLNNRLIDYCQVWNGSDVHASLIPVLLTADEAAGQHNIELRKASGVDTESTVDDWYNVTVIELN